MQQPLKEENNLTYETKLNQIIEELSKWSKEDINNSLNCVEHAVYYLKDKIEVKNKGAKVLTSMFDDASYIEDFSEILTIEILYDLVVKKSNFAFVSNGYFSKKQNLDRSLKYSKTEMYHKHL